MSPAPGNHKSAVAQRPTSAETRQRLVAAASEEFNSGGFFGTDTNRIARKAGFAPQTFYRHFSDKLDVFLAVYSQWHKDERAAIAAALESPAAARKSDSIAAAIVHHHREWAVFRRSLRLLAIEEPKVRNARALGRNRQIQALAAIPPNAGRPLAELASAVLTIERLCDALADNETQDLDIADADWIGLIGQAVAAARGD